MLLKRWFWLLLTTVALCACGGGGDDSSTGGGEGEQTPSPSPDDKPDDPQPENPDAPEFFSTGFMKGSTMSFAQYVRDLGLVYRENGVETDPYESMKRHGANIVRLQLNYEGAWSYQGQNIAASRKKIEDVLETLVHAFEQQQDKLFQSDAMDVEAEIRVLETMMAADGLVKREGGM